ncbi:GNAT family N-acetyltransferase [Flavobacterium sp.]|uniref:GNAT family N-acetyltransferase n=1 Tax=Flavobacterium sp. TaxID=239 RepID=UPI003D0E6E1D
MIHLREHLPEDFTALRSIFNDPDVIKYVSKNYCFSDDQLKKMISPDEEVKNIKQFSAIYNECMVGSCMYKFNNEMNFYEIGYAVLKEHRGKGLALKITKSLIEKIKSDDCVKELYAKVALDNVNSVRVLIKLGAKKDREVNYDGSIELIYRIF